MIPITDPDSFQELARAVGRNCWQYTSGDCYLIVDEVTAASLAELASFSSVAEQVLVMGRTPAAWAKADNVQEYPQGSAMVPEHERLLILLSPLHSVAIFYTNSTTGAGGHVSGRWAGGWTCRQDLVWRFGKLVGEQAGGLWPQAMEASPPAQTDASLALATELMARHVEVLSRQRRDASVDKGDLFCVLEILKAISSRRRSHDILFVFVEKIAQIIGIDRCSVVRLWGGSEMGHVLASHEDSQVYNLLIDVRKYPELQHVLHTGAKVIVNDVQADPLLQEFATELAAAEIASILVIPIVLHDENVGSLFLRAARRKGAFSDREINFCEIVAEAASNALERAHLFESIQRANERLEYLAVTDGLTGLYNHRHIRERLDEEFERAQRYHLPLSCLLLDIDNFKQINDTWGHLQGDYILRELARRITASVRKSDIIARYGGEEFIVVLPQTGVEGAKVEADRLLRHVNSKVFEGMSDDQRVTISIGVAVLEHDKMTSGEAMIRLSDNALYEAKRLGKNCVVVGSS
ncbi:MAG: sensor domain-containing diguanylate cyclase [Candidatus Hydrogenedentota bacterium]